MKIKTVLVNKLEDEDKLNNEVIKIYLMLYIIFAILTFVYAGYNILNQGNVGFAVISMLIGLVFAGLYRETKKINDIKKV